MLQANNWLPTKILAIIGFCSIFRLTKVDCAVSKFQRITLQKTWYRTHKFFRNVRAILESMVQHGYPTNP